MKLKIDNRASVFCGIACVLIWVIVSLMNPCIKVFCSDEIHAWNIATHFNLIDIIRLMNAEGHSFLWFYVIKPLTYFDNLFLIKIVNWLFACAAIIFMWIKAPFNTITKVLISFSYPFLLLYPAIARCYSIGIFFLFLICSLYRNRLKRPYLYSILIFIAANTSLMVAIPALILGFMFGCELIKRKTIKPALILILAPISLLIQWSNPIIPDYSVYYVFSDRITDFLEGRFKFSWCSQLSYYLYVFVLITSLLYFRGKYLLFFVSSCLSLFLVFYYVYTGFDYHFYFFYIYLIIAYWISNPNSFKIFFVIAFSLLSFLYIFKKPFPIYCPYFNWQKDEITDLIMDELNVNSIVYTTIQTVDFVLPYLKNVKLKDFENNNIISFENFHTIYSRRIKPNMDNLYSIVPSNSYILVKISDIDNLNLDFSEKNSYKTGSGLLLYKFK